MSDLETSVDEIATETGFSGVVRVDRDGTTEIARAYGLADRGLQVPNTVGTQLAIASGGKGMTALAVVSLINDGTIEPTTTARSVLGLDLPLIDDAVTVEHLLGHRSGIGDYIDEDDDAEITDYVMARPVQELGTTEAFLPLLDGFPTKFAPGTGFSYCNGGYVVLALIAERASDTSFHDLVEQRVLAPAGMSDTAFLRSDELPGRAARNYLWVDSLRTNVLHLPVRGNGDGGVFSTVADIHTFWDAFFAGRIVPSRWVKEMVRPRSDVPAESARYGLGIWLHPTGNAVKLEGYDAGVSFRTVHDPDAAVTHTVISNWSGGAWPVCRRLNELLGTD